MEPVPDGRSVCRRRGWVDENARERLEMSGSIVCGVDGSAGSQAALDVAARLAVGLGARLVLAHAVEYEHEPYAAPGSLGGGVLPERPMLSDRATGQDEIETIDRLVKEIADESGLGGAQRRVLGDTPWERLADLASAENAELIVVGSRGRGRLKAASLGRVSSSLVGVARCPVLIVPLSAADVV
jgi:nucleotide-binding universal stress UspA family protein